MCDCVCVYVCDCVCACGCVGVGVGVCKYVLSLHSTIIFLLRSFH